jgi:hypothetical protein
MASPNTNRKEGKDSADLYSTPVVALEAIKDYLLEDFDKGVLSLKNTIKILEPCAGINSVSDWLMHTFVEGDDHGIEVETNELYDYGQHDYNVDFLNNDIIPDGYDFIISNPPYTKAVEFILQGFEHAPVQWHLLRLSFLEGQKRFKDLFNLGKLSDVYIFTYRVSCPKGVNMEPSPNSVCYAWYRFDKNYSGQPKLHWLTK